MRLDLHVHFDSSRPLRENIQRLSNIPIDGFALCGLRNIEYIKDIKKSLHNKIVIVGQEIFTQSLHIIALGIDRAIDHGFSVEETVYRIHSQGGLAIAAHPIINPLALISFLRNAARYDFDAIEGFNGFLSPLVIPNYLAQLASRIINIPWISASDAHALEHVGSSYIDIPCDNRDYITDIFWLIKNNKFKTRNSSYFDFRHYRELAIGLRCAACNARVTFKKDFCWMACLVCQKSGRTNLACKNGHYICEGCLLNIC